MLSEQDCLLANWLNCSMFSVRKTRQDILLPSRPQGASGLVSIREVLYSYLVRLTVLIQVSNIGLRKGAVETHT